MLLTFYYFLIIAFYLSHSVLASDMIKLKVYKIIKPGTYRILYNIISTVLIILIMGIYGDLEHKNIIFFKNQSYWGWAITVIGIVLGYYSFKSYNLKEFLGLSEEELSPVLSVNGLNKYVRHPLYFSGLFTLWGFLLVSPTLEYFIFAVISTVYIFIGTKLEERKLENTFGKDFREYKARVPMLFPDIINLIKIK
jgi:methanethiol S-methyltransferase